MHAYTKFRTRQQLVIEWFATGWDTFDIAMRTQTTEAEIYNLLSSRQLKAKAA